MSSDYVNYMSGHIDIKYLDQAFWFHGSMTAPQSPKSVTSATMESPNYQCVPSQDLSAIEYRNDDITKKLFLYFSVLDTMYQWSMMKNIHSPNFVGIGSWGPKIWPHEYLISPIEISVNWLGSKRL